MTREKGKPTVRNVPFFGTPPSTKSLPTAIVLLGLATVCLGGSPQEDPSADIGKSVLPDRRGIASNQSASLHDSGALIVGAASVDDDADRSLTDEVAAQRTARVGRHVPRDAASSTPSAPTLPDVPWYRTGIGALSIVLTVIAVAVWSIRRWMPKLGGGGCSVLNVVGRAGLSPKHSVALVSLGRRFVLVGLSGDRMTPICEVSDPQEVAELTLRLGRSRSPGMSVSTGGDAKSFESLLTGEVNEYAHVPEPRNNGAGAKDRQGNAPASRLHRAREPLGALLERLRSVKMK